MRYLLSFPGKALPDHFWPRGLALALLSYCLLITSGCVTTKAIKPIPPKPIAKINWTEHVRQLTLLEDWQLKGKIGIKQNDDGGSAYINWIQSGDSFYITLSGPLGQGTTIISGNEDGAKLESASEGTFIAESPEELLYTHTGWHIPLHYLLYWIKGLPEPRTPAIATYTPKGYIETLTQGPWQLSFYRYESDLGVTLPHKIKITNQDLKVTLAIKDWEAIESNTLAP